jgi:hypothetical protein
VNSWKVILATMVIFGTGVVTGGLLVRNSQRIQFLPPQANPNFPRPPQQNASAGGSRVEFLRRVERDLTLTSEQRERIDKIIAASQERTRKIMEPVTPRMREELQRTKEEFRQALNPDQRVRFDDLLKQQQRPRDQRRSVPPHERPAESFAAPLPSGESPRNP